MSHPQSAQTISSRVERFLFSEEIPFGLALVRITLPLVMLGTLFPRWFRVREIYSLDGAPAPLTTNYAGWEHLLPLLPAPLAVALFSALILCFITLSLGWMTRVSAIACFVLYTYFSLADTISTLTKYSVIVSHGLLLLSVSRCGDCWSVDAWISRRARLRSGATVLNPPRSAAWPRRLTQLLIGIIYLGAAATKMHTPAYFTGDQLVFWMRTDLNFNNPLGDYLAFYPVAAQVMAYATIIWEMLFLFLCWHGLSRKVMLSVGVVFHLMTTLILGLVFFPLIYLSLYLAFVDEKDVAWMKQTLHDWGIRRLTDDNPTWHTADTAEGVENWWEVGRAAPLFGVFVVGVMLLGVTAEHRLDLYGERRPEGRYVLQPASEQRLDQLFGEPREVSATDQLFSFDLGTFTVGGTLADRRRTYSHGEQAVVQCCFNPPHRDMWIEVDLHDQQDRIVMRNGQVLPREMLRSSLVYSLDEAFLPGEYSFVLKIDGREIARRRFLLQGSETVSVR